MFWWPLLLRRDHYCSEAKTKPNVSTVSWEIYDPIPKFYLNMMRVKTSLLSLQAGSLVRVQRTFWEAELPSHKETGTKELTFPWPILLVGWLLHCQGTHFSLAHSPCGMAAPLPRNSLFLGPFSSKDGGSATKNFLQTSTSGPARRV